MEQDSQFNTVKYCKNGLKGVLALPRRPFGQENESHQKPRHALPPLTRHSAPKITRHR
jgi:hypothetical protein